ncbi:hypothetical protein ACRZXV_001013 [Serratia liquefaciens]
MMLKPLFTRHPLLIKVIGLFAPRSVQDEAYLQDIAAFLGAQPCSHGQ